MTDLSDDFSAYTLPDRYARPNGRVFLSGTQALVRIVLDQARRDRAAGLNTAGLVSGYRGSPLGGVDQELWRSEALLESARIDFLPAVNEELAATAVLGSQQVETNPDAQYDGVFAMWYGKGPGLDRAGDALKHGNAYGTSPHGGVLVVAGDDHGSVSSSMPHQSDVAFMAWFMPVLAPSSVAEYLEYGAYGYALSRFSGMWVGFKAVSETVESAQSVVLPPERAFARPDFSAPPEGLHYRWPDLPGPHIETRLAAKKRAVFAFARANPIDRAIYGVKDARFGIVTSGKAHLDVMEALRLLGLDAAVCRDLGIDIYKVGMVWPLPRVDALNFVRGKQEVLVCEEKRGVIESQLKEYFYDWPGDKPARMVGKNDENLNPLIPWTGELSPLLLVAIIAARLERLFPDQGFAARARALSETPQLLEVPGATRTPYFCSGCPHNSSTKVPEGSAALAGIGCHFMAIWMGRNTSSLIQMGGEGVNWAASSRFTGRGHVFQNLGEGTWYHSGSMAIRQAIAAGTNITYKILYNDAVAMTGGQPVDGPVSVAAIAHICRAEGVARIALVSDDPARLNLPDFPPHTTLHQRHDMDALQRELRDIPGVTVLIYDQVCAAEKRRRRKRGTLADPARFAVINALVCEGCGDCSTQSNCLSVEPIDTPFGRKRRINLSSCNKDFSCLDGFCPSFITIEGGARRPPDAADIDIQALLRDIAAPTLPTLVKPYDLLVTGVGGTGVVTLGALVTMAAHLEGKGASVLDFTGFAQKFGAVLSFVRLAAAPDAINQVRIENGRADAVIGCDVVVTTSPKASACFSAHSRIVLNRARMPTGDLVLNRDASLLVGAREELLRNRVGAANLWAFDANRMAEALLGDAVFANVMLLGYAWQRALVPVTLAALFRAIELNGVAPDKNKAAFSLGRILAARPDALPDLDKPAEPDTLAEVISARAAFLRGYQNAAYAARYRARLAEFAQAVPDQDLQDAAARALFKLMAYKDEYEVARLQSDPAFLDGLARQFTGDFKINYHMAPPFFTRARDAHGRPRKRRFGPGMGRAMAVLARLKGLRGSPLDVFGYSAERRAERALIGWYTDLMQQCTSRFGGDGVAIWRDILSAPMDIRGYGPIKMAAIVQARARVGALLAQSRDTAAAAPSPA